MSIISSSVTARLVKISSSSLEEEEEEEDVSVSPRAFTLSLVRDDGMNVAMLFLWVEVVKASVLEMHMLASIIAIVLVDE
eukprot:873128-Ditylum_brightwellii.AAC.1